MKIVRSEALGSDTFRFVIADPISLAQVGRYFGRALSASHSLEKGYLPERVESPTKLFWERDCTIEIDDENFITRSGLCPI